MMQTSAIRRQYDEVIAPHYDLDPYAVIARSLERALGQLVRHGRLATGGDPLRVLDLGMGTGTFLTRLRAHTEHLKPFGIDISQKMIDIARERIPDLVAEVDDAANLDGQFGPEPFELICSHFVTGFVSVDVLAPRVHARLKPRGYWSLVGGTKAGFPVLRKKASGRLAKFLFGGRSPAVDEVVVNPADRGEVERALTANGFAIVEAETFTPGLDFKNLDEFMDFAYYGGWLTPFIEGLGLHTAKAVTRAALNAFFFPVRDHHSIEVVLARKATS